MSELDCGDHGCLFAKDKSGMRTNGGCRCIADSRVRFKVMELMNENRALKSLVDGAMEIVFLFKTESPAQSQWKHDWLKKARAITK